MSALSLCIGGKFGTSGYERKEEEEEEEWMEIGGRRRTRSLIDIVYRFDRSPRPPAGIDHAAFHGGEIRKGV